MIKKTYFEAPQAELIEVRFEEGFLTLSDQVNSNNHTQYLTGDPNDGYEEL